jgi:ketosteroid isomerase-like protein
MQPCDELKNIVLQNYEKLAYGKVLEVVRSTYSPQEGVIVVGTDPNEWFEGFDSILHFYGSSEGHRLDVKVDVLKAYCEGNVGWTIDRVTVKLPNGVELPIRHTHIFHKENGAWKIVHNHVSIAVPNDKIGE